MMLPRAQTACSQTFWCGELRSSRKRGTAPACTTAWVCWLVPLAMLVRAQADSNYRTGYSIITPEIVSHLQHRVLCGPEKLDEAGNDSGLNDLKREED